MPTAKKPAPKRVVPKVSPKAGLSLDEYLRGLDAGVRPLVTALTSLVRAAAPEATVAIKWSRPVFASNGPFGYVHPAKHHVTLGFWRGTEISDPDGILEGDGERMMHVKVRALDEVPTEALTRMVREAVALNATLGDPTRR